MLRYSAGFYGYMIVSKDISFSKSVSESVSSFSSELYDSYNSEVSSLEYFSDNLFGDIVLCSDLMVLSASEMTRLL